MPDISKFLEEEAKKANKTKKPFVKKKYRPWDMHGLIPEILPEEKLETNQPHISNKVTTKQKRSSIKKANTPISENKVVTGSEAGTKKKQSGIKKPGNTKSSTKVETPGKKLTNQPKNSSNKLVTNHQQSGSEKKVKKYTVAKLHIISDLVGLQKKILVHIFESCKKTETLISEQISIATIADMANTTIQSAKESIRRLRQKGFLDKHHFKDGKGGFTIYLLPEPIYNELWENERDNEVITN